MRSSPIIATIIAAASLAIASTARAEAASVMADYPSSARAMLLRESAAPAGRTLSAADQREREAVARAADADERFYAAVAAANAETGDEADPPRGKKSPKKAFFLSLLLPGLGEFYAGHPYRAAAFLAVEGAAWTTWGVFRAKGADWKDQYVAWQAEHWSPDRYYAYRSAVWDYVARTTDVFDPTYPLAQRQQDSVLVVVGTHEYDACCGRPLPNRSDQLEMIGKYSRFAYGWDDATVFDDSTQLLSSHFPAPPGTEPWGTDVEDWKSVDGGRYAVSVPTPGSGVIQVQTLGRVRSVNRDHYMDLRAKSNDAYSTARAMTTVALFNRIISAIHAARITSAANANAGRIEPPRTDFRMELRERARTTRYGVATDYVPTLVVRRAF